MSGHNIIGKSIPQIHAWDKVTGRAKYTDDLRLQRPLIIKILRSPHASAQIISINLEQAEKMPGVRGTLVGGEIKNTFGVLPISKDEPALAKTSVRYVGEAVAAVAAETEVEALSALEKIQVEYKVTTSVLSGEQALKDTTEPIHPELKKSNNLHKRVNQSFGNLGEGFALADMQVEGEFEFPSVTHAFTEPHATQVELDGQGNVTVYSATQVPHYLHRALHEVLEIPMHQIRVIKPHLGGGFGGKSDPFPHEMIATKLALKTGRNTRLTLTREEVFFSHHGRHPTKIRMKMGVAKDKGITALEGKMLIDGGAYGSFGVVTSYYNGVLLQGPYRINNFSFECQRVYTNKPMCGAMRGHGGVNPRFAGEVLIDEACEKLGLDPCEFRLQNLHPAYSLAPNQFRITSQGLSHGLKRAMEKSQWKKKYRQLPFGHGIGVACGFFISGSALPIHWNEMPQSKVRLTIDYDGGVTLYSGASDIGQGSDTMMAQITAEVLGMPLSMVKVISADTRLTPIDLGSYSSRVTFMAGNAAKNAAVSMRRILRKAACDLWKIPEVSCVDSCAEFDFFKQGNKPPEWDKPFLGANVNYTDGLDFRDETISYQKQTLPYLEVVRKALDHSGVLETSGIYVSPKLGGTFKGAGAGLSPAYSMTAFITEVKVGPETGFVKIIKVTCAHDCGRALNPQAVEGQLEGSIHMGLGQALMEAVTHQSGAVMNANFLDYKIPSPFEMPEVELIYDDSGENEGPFGAKEVGEGALAPFIPSVANAIYDAVGIRLKSLPMTPDKILQEMAK